MDLLVEMVRQRLTQDFQLVSEDYIRANNYRRETLNDGLVQRGHVVSNEDNSGMIRYFLSMGHRLQVLTYDPSAADVIEVTRYNAKHAQKNSIFQYHYLSYCQETKSYNRVAQTFEKYGEEYNWNKVDRLISGGDDKEMREGMRFRRIMFGIIPDAFADEKAEAAYASKFRRLLDYFEKIRPKGDSSTPLDIKFVTSKERQNLDKVERIESTPGLARNSMHRFYVQLRKGKREHFEWIEIAIDSTFDTTWSYRIMFSWLVASAGKVDTQVQLLQRRCTQYGLNLVPFPQISVSKNVYLNPFKAPAILTIRDKNRARHLDRALTKIDFLHDGVFATDVRTILDCMESSHDFHFERRWGIPLPGRNFVHRSGTLFVRVLTDRNGRCVLIVLGNYRYILSTKDAKIVASYDRAFQALSDCVASLGEEVELPPPPPPQPVSKSPSPGAALQGSASPVKTPSPRSKVMATGSRSQTKPVNATPSGTPSGDTKRSKSPKDSQPTAPGSNSPRSNNHESISIKSQLVDTNAFMNEKSTTVTKATSMEASEGNVVDEEDAKVEQLAAPETSESRDELIGIPIVDSEDSQQQAHTDR